MSTELSNNELYASAKKNLFSFGSDFMTDLIVRTEGMYLYTASGKKVLDWTSGQMYVSTFAVLQKNQDITCPLQENLCLANSKPPTLGPA